MSEISDYQRGVRDATEVAKIAVAQEREKTKLALETLKEMVWEADLETCSSEVLQRATDAIKQIEETK